MTNLEKALRELHKLINKANPDCQYKDCNRCEFRHICKFNGMYELEWMIREAEEDEEDDKNNSCEIVIELVDKEFCPHNVPREMRYKIGLEQPVICNAHCGDCFFCISEWLEKEESKFVPDEDGECANCEHWTRYAGAQEELECAGVCTQITALTDESFYCENYKKKNV